MMLNAGGEDSKRQDMSKNCATAPADLWIVYKISEGDFDTDLHTYMYLRCCRCSFAHPRQALWSWAG